MKYLKYFETETAYTAYKNGSDFVLPNVSYVEEIKGVSYEPKKPKKAFVLRAKYNATPDNLVAFTDASNIKSLKVNGTPIEFEPVKNEINTFDVLGENITQDMETSAVSFPESYLIKSPVSSWSFKSKDPNYVMNENTYVCMLGIMDGMTMANPMPLSEAMDYAFTTNDGVTLEAVDTFLAEMNMQIESGLQIGFTLADMDMNSQTLVFIDTEHQTKVITGGLSNYSFDAEGSYDVEIELADPDMKGMQFAGTPLVSIEISNGVNSISDFAFVNCIDLTSVTVGSDVISIGEGAFVCCKSLTSINIPNGVNSINDSTFSDCSGLTSIVIPDSVTSIGNNAFWGCSGLTSINIPNSVTNIGSSAFQKCSGLTSIVIPDSITTIGNNTFYDCSGLTSVTIGSGVTSIGTYAFINCSSLNEIICKGNTAPQIYDTTFGNYKSSIKKFGVLTVPDNADYSSWMSTDEYYLGYHNWTIEYI